MRLATLIFKVLGLSSMVSATSIVMILLVMDGGLYVCEPNPFIRCFEVLLGGFGIATGVKFFYDIIRS